MLEDSLTEKVTNDLQFIAEQFRPGARRGVTWVLFAKRFRGIFWKGNVSTLWKPTSYKNLIVRQNLTLK